MSALTHWAQGPFELILHAEMHFRNGEDFDRRIALVGFDNAIEVAIQTYLDLHPIQRQGRTYTKNEVEQWSQNYHTKIDFFESEIQARTLAAVCTKANFIWYHEVRNGQYHGGGATIPQSRELEGIREAAIWVFSVLFDVADVITLLDQNIARVSDDLPEKNAEDDRLIDEEYGVVRVAGKARYTSEVVHALDPVLYSELANEIRKRDVANDEMNATQSAEIPQS